MKLLKKKKILGIDPGTNILGYGLIELFDNKIKLIELDILRIDKIKEPSIKLKHIYECISLLIRKHKPSEVAVEAPFYGRNIQSMLKLGRAQGVAIVASANYDIPVYEYAPKKIKMAVTGRGQASKEQVATMLMYMLNIKIKPKEYDSTDGLAVAVCHALQNNILNKKAKKTNWTDFIKDNPDRIN